MTKIYIKIGRIKKIYAILFIQKKYNIIQFDFMVKIYLLWWLDVFNVKSPEPNNPKCNQKFDENIKII